METWLLLIFNFSTTYYGKLFCGIVYDEFSFFALKSVNLSAVRRKREVSVMHTLSSVRLNVYQPRLQWWDWDCRPTEMLFQRHWPPDASADLFISVKYAERFRWLQSNLTHNKWKKENGKKSLGAIYLDHNIPSATGDMPINRGMTQSTWWILISSYKKSTW